MRMRPSRLQTTSRECSLRKMILTMPLFSNWLSSPGSTSCRKSPDSLQYSLTKPAASPTKNFRLLQPNSAAVISVSCWLSLSLVKIFSRVPVMRLQTRTSLEVNRKMVLVLEQTRKSKTEWNQLIYFDFFSREGARNWVIFFSQTRHQESSGIIYSREGFMKFFQQFMTWIVWNLRKSQMRMLSLSSKESTQGNDFRNLAASKLPLCSLYLPENPLDIETSRAQTQISELKPQESRQLPNQRVQSIPRMPFFWRPLMAELVCSPMCSRVTFFLRQTEQNLTLPSMEEVARYWGYQTSTISVMRESCCLRTRTEVKSRRVRLRQETVLNLTSPDLERKAQYLCMGRQSTLWKLASFLTSHSLQVLTLPSSLRLQKRALPSKMAPKIMLSLSKAKSAMKAEWESEESWRQSTSSKVDEQMRMRLEPASRRQQRWSRGRQTIFLTQLRVPGSTTAAILYSLLILEQAEEMTSFSWKALFLQLGLSTRRMFSMMYSVNSDHSR